MRLSAVGLSRLVQPQSLESFRSMLPTAALCYERLLRVVRFFLARAVPAAFFPVGLARLRFVLEATRMLSTRLGYGRPARFADALAFAFCDFVSLLWRLDFGAGLRHGARFDLAPRDDFEVFGMRPMSRATYHVTVIDVTPIVRTVGGDSLLAGFAGRRP